MSMPHCCNPAGHAMPETLEDGTATVYNGGWIKPAARSFVKQDSSAISFFQFQLCHEESRLRGISVDRLLAPDKNGNRLLHVAVTQGKRALTYVLAWRFAYLNRIDEKDAAKQTALHLAAQNNHHLIASDLISLGASVNAKDGLEKTPLHLCAEKGYVRVLEVLRNCQGRGIHVEVDAADNQGLTPLQCAAFAHSTLSMDLKKRHLSPEAQKVQGLRKEQILNGINCLVQMGADPWLQGAKCSSQASSYFAKVQEDNELMSVFDTHRPKWQEDSVPGPEGTTLLYLQGEDVQPLMTPFLSFFEHFPEDAM
ncbi:NF-kappa-B inhibitor zeta-like [Elgaria multicarinata webbii]|uniref:NF-kappa-B inhibitor zeta-like n=1 Tax=Elgaria multicarinata webbii TaxID=159646 RepID=UPI002FCD1774